MIIGCCDTYIIYYILLKALFLEQLKKQTTKRCTWHKPAKDASLQIDEEKSSANESFGKSSYGSEDDTLESNGQEGIDTADGTYAGSGYYVILLVITK